MRLHGIGRAGASSVSKANLRAERSVTSELIRQETKIKSIVLFKTCSLSSRSAVGQMYLVAHNNNSQGGCGARIRQTEE